MPPKRKLPLSTWNSQKKKLKKVSEAYKKNYVNRVLLTKPLGSERKWAIINFAKKDLFCGSAYGFHPLYWLAQGTQQDQRIGLTLQNVILYFDVTYSHIGSTNASNPTSQNSSYRSVVFANPTQWHQAAVATMEANTAGVGTVIPTSSVFLDNSLDRTTKSYLNNDYNKILYDSKTIVVNNPTQTYYNGVNGYAHHMRFTVKLGDVRFNANGSQSYLRDDQVYYWITATTNGQNAPGAADFAGNVAVNMLCTWKDS